MAKSLSAKTQALNWSQRSPRVPMTLASLGLRLLTRTIPSISCSASPVLIMLVRMSAAALLLAISYCDAASCDWSSLICCDCSSSTAALSSSSSSWPYITTCLRRRLLPTLSRWAPLPFMA